MRNPWIRSRRWDLGWLVGSVLAVPIAPLLYQAFRSGLGWSEAVAAERVAMIVMLAVGGPHVFVTFTRTNMDPRFVRRHRLYSSLAYLVPVGTAVFALNYTALFLTFFFTWASLHVLQQIAYVSNCYSNRQALAPTPRERLFEYGLIFSCLYPFATIRMVEGTFMLDGTRLLVPEALLGPGLVVAAFAVFGFFLLGWLAYAVRRYRGGTLHYGKTALVGATVGATLFTPLFPNLDVAFQGINTWHCIQYLALIWWANRIRMERGEAEWGFLKAIGRGGVRGFLRYYSTAVLGTVFLLGLIYFANWALGVSFLLAYYMLGKGVLLTHYYYDTFLFTQRDELSQPAPAASAAPVTAVA